jgi:hypothetical protein
MSAKTKVTKTKTGFRGKVKEIHDVVAVIGKYAQNGPKSRWTMFLQFKIHNSRRQLPMKLVAP